MIDEKDYLEAKKRIAEREDYYARKAMRTNITTDRRNLWGFSDGMKECLAILKECIEKKDDLHDSER